ncbi:hypothetical protein [Nocardia sp. CNY236]|uniref:hypothetical protein n=1 Tax=Nocardia sp. CNY236 TaxID=1169152 RepID=UPI00040161EA|nr:hypothetical protein [Nocardia sp. CNY236]
MAAVTGISTLLAFCGADPAVHLDGVRTLDTIVLPLVAAAVAGTWYLILVGIAFSLQRVR